MGWSGGYENGVLILQHPAKVGELVALLAAHDAEQSPPAWPSLIEAPIPIDRTLRDPQLPGEEFIYWPN